MNLLDENKVYEQTENLTPITDQNTFVDAAMKYADQLNTRYTKFATDISGGIRKRAESTGIYAHAMAVIMDTDDLTLINGLSLDKIYQQAHKRQSRIQKGNLRTVLQKIEELQVDEGDRGLVIAFNDANDEVTAIDRTVLFYRKYSTVNWPWEDLIKETAGQYGDEGTIIIR